MLIIIASIWVAFQLTPATEGRDSRLWNLANSLAMAISVSVLVLWRKSKRLHLLHFAVSAVTWVALAAVLMLLFKQVIPIDMDPNSFKVLRMGLELIGLFLLLASLYLSQNLQNRDSSQ